MLTICEMKTYNGIVFDVVGLAPRTHDPSVVECNDSNDINALALQCSEVLDVAREMLCRAAGSESTWNREENDLFPCELCIEVLADVDSCMLWGSRSAREAGGKGEQYEVPLEAS